MKTFKRLLIVCVAIGALVQTTAHAVAPDRTITLQPGATVQWTGDARAATNVLYWDATGTGTGAGVCTKNIDSFCERVHVTYSNPVPDTDADGRLFRSSLIQIDWDLLVSDYDVVVFRSNANGDRLDLVDASAKYVLDGEDQAPEQVAITVQTTRAQPTAYFLIEIVYFAAVGGYTGSVRF